MEDLLRYIEVFCFAVSAMSDFVVAMITLLVLIQHAPNLVRIMRDPSISL